MLVLAILVLLAVTVPLAIFALPTSHSRAVARLARELRSETRSPRPSRRAVRAARRVLSEGSERA